MQTTKMIIHSEHYRFEVHENSLAHKEIDRIIDIQETAFANITRQLGFTSQLKIQYNLLTSPIFCGRAFNTLLENAGCEPIAEYRVNAFAWFPNMVYATYNKSIKAIGCHEDAHLLAYEYFGQVSSRFMTEGLAVAFDEYWQGIPVHECAKKILEKHSIQIPSLLNDADFDSRNDTITYPIAGSVCLWIIQTAGMEDLKKAYKESLHNYMYLAETCQLADYVSFLNKWS